MYDGQKVIQEILIAESRIRSFIRKTILEPSDYFSQIGQTSVFFKLENLQHTGSFKIRGATNKLISLSLARRMRGVVTASTGNHGAAVALGSSKLGIKGIVFVPENADSNKVKAIERVGAEVRYYGNDNADTEVYARQYAEKNDVTYISPYNDLCVVAGQGTIGIELERQLQQIDAVFVSLGGGGLISGVGIYLKCINPDVNIIGCSPENSQVMIQSVKAGKILALPSLPTLSDGTAGGIEPGTITFDLCQAYVDDYMTVTEDEIKNSIRLFMDTHHMLIEGAAAVSIASYLKMKASFRNKNVVIIICGANISSKTLKRVFD
jgi:threonine dehydratase